MARRTLTDNGVAALKPRAKRYVFSDPAMPGHYVRVMPSGAKSFVVVTRGLDGKQKWKVVGLVGQLTLAEAREKARATIAAIKAGKSTADCETFAAVAESWFQRHVIKKGLRSHADLRRVLDNNILPSWAGREFGSIRRGDVAKLLDEIEDTRGPVAADKTLAVISAMASWYNARHEDYINPIVRGMRRSNPKERARDRILTDDEIREVWRQAEANGTFGAIVRVLLLTGQRLDKVRNMKWDDVSVDGTWTIATEIREKGNAGALTLSEMATEIIRSLPRFESNPYVFAGRGDAHYNSFGRAKAEFDGKLSLPHWTLHDLRRTARSLMSRAGVRPNIAERVLGHAVAGVHGIYDRHQYCEEKAYALRMLAELIENILRPAGS